MYEYESRAHAKDLEKARTERLQPSPSCLKCVHMKVCVIHRNIAPMMESLYAVLKDEDKPFKAQDIAKICQWYELKDEPTYYSK